MATVYSGEVSVGTYNRIRIKCDYSGTSATLTIQFRRTSSYTGTWADTQATLTFNGQSKAANYSYSGTVGTSWVNLRGAISGYTISTSGGTYNWTFNNPGGSSVLGCSGTITVPSQAVAPTTPTVSASNPGTTNSNSITWGTTSMGTPSSGTVYLYGGTSASPTTQLTTKTTTGNSTYTHSSLAANTKYHYRARANNGQWSSYSSEATAVTRAAAPSVSVGTRTVNSIQINYSTAADGNAYSKSIQYSLDGTNWSTGATVSTGSASSGSYNITGRTANTSYSVRTRVNTTAGATTGSTLTAVTLAAAPTVSVNSVTDTSITVDYSTAADGNAYSKNIQYSKDNSTWTTGVTVSTGSATSGAYGVYNCTPNTVCTIYTRVNTTAGITNGATLTAVTLPSSPNISISNITDSSATLNYSVSADGNAYVKHLQISLDNGANWYTIATISSGSATSGTYTLEFLEKAKTYTVLGRIHTVAGNSSNGSVTFVASNDKLYGPVNDSATKIWEFYGPVNNQAKQATKIYASENGRAKLIFKEK